MEMEKQRTHLTPDEVQEFINLGVDFGDTADIWIKVGKRWERRSREFQSELDDMLPDVEAGLGFNLQKNVVSPAPNMAELLEVLPKYLQRKHSYDTEKYYLSLWRDSDGEWILAYDKPYVGVISSHIDDNPLECAIRLLRWVCQNHPETLTKTE